LLNPSMYAPAVFLCKGRLQTPTDWMQLGICCLLCPCCSRFHRRLLLHFAENIGPAISYITQVFLFSSSTRRALPFCLPALIESLIRMVREKFTRVSTSTVHPAYLEV